MKKSKQSNSFQARQGDVLVMADERAHGTTEIARENGDVILAHGEVTGHAHAIRVPGVCHLRAEGIHEDAMAVTTALLVEADSVPLTHEEHATVEIPKGRSFVIQQEEYTPEEYRNVLD